MIALEQRLALGHVEGVVALEAPGVQCDGDVVGERIVAGEIEVDQAGELVAEEEGVVRKEIGVDDALRQAGRPVGLQVVELLLDGGGEPGSDLVGTRTKPRIERSPAGKSQGVGPGKLEISAGQMHPRHGLPQGPAVARLRAPDPNALQEGDERSRPAHQRTQHASLGIVYGRGAGEAGSRQMLHQAEEEREVARGHPLLVERQEEGALLGVHEVVGVLDALGNALVGEQRAEIVAGDEFGQLVVGHFRIDRHALDRR